MYKQLPKSVHVVCSYLEMTEDELCKVIDIDRNALEFFAMPLKALPPLPGSTPVAEYFAQEHILNKRAQLRKLKDLLLGLNFVFGSEQEVHNYLWRRRRKLRGKMLIEKSRVSHPDYLENGLQSVIEFIDNWLHRKQLAESAHPYWRYSGSLFLPFAQCEQVTESFAPDYLEDQSSAY